MAGIGNGLDFGVRPAETAVPASAHHTTAFDEHGTDHRVGRDSAASAPGKVERLGHER
jgi:hypothetical protein